jgi:hypothetical protein
VTSRTWRHPSREHLRLRQPVQQQQQQLCVDLRPQLDDCVVAAAQCGSMRGAGPRRAGLEDLGEDPPQRPHRAMQDHDVVPQRHRTVNMAACGCVGRLRQAGVR